MRDPRDRASVRAVEREVRALHRLERDIFLAHRLDGMSCREIAERTGLGVDQVERYLARAIAQLARALNPVR